LGEKRNGYEVLVGKPEGKRPVGRYKHGKEDNFVMDLKAIGWEYGLVISGSR
jgi:hypothetical protein